MALHEKLKSAKIAEEIFNYMIQYGYKKVNLTMDMKDEFTSFILLIDKKDKGFIEDFKREMFCCRDESIEEYAWEMMTYDTCECNLDNIAKFIDSYQIKELEDHYEVIMNRNI